MARREEPHWSREAEEKFQELAHPPTEDPSIGSGGGGGSEGPGVTGIAGTGAVRSTGFNEATTSGGATGAGTLGTGSGVSGTGSADNLGNTGAGQDPSEGRLAPEGASMSDAGATPRAGAGLGPEGSAGAAHRDVGDGDVSLGRESSQGMPMRSGPGAAGQ